jgi:hypothetical protein
MSNELKRYDLCIEEPAHGAPYADLFETKSGDYVLHSDALAAIEAAKPKWLPINSAPKDGTVIVAYSPVDGVRTTHFEGGLWQGGPWRPVHNPLFEKSKLTHWQPLPPPPESE